MGANARWGGAEFHGHRTLGQIKISDDTLKARLSDSLFRGIEENDGTMSACFQPRHGIRARRGWRTVDVVICFECSGVHFHQWGRVSRDNVSASPRSLFDETLRAACVRVARPAF